MENMFNRSDKFEAHILERVGNKVYLDCCTLGFDPIEVYKKRKELEENEKDILIILGNSTEFGYLVTYVLRDEEDGADITTVDKALDKPVFAYVQNLPFEDCSEYGYVQITKQNGLYKRVY